MSYFLCWISSELYNGTSDKYTKGLEPWSKVSVATHIFLPLAGLAILWGRRDLFTRLLMQLDRSCVAVYCPSFSRREKLLKWASGCLPSTWSSQSKTLSGGISELWRDGSLLCTLINSAIAGACPNPHRHWKKTPTHAQALAYKYLQVVPIFTDADFNGDFSPQQERKFLQYITDLQQAIIKLASEEYHSANWSSQYVVRGMGISTAEQYRKSDFYVYSTGSNKNQNSIMIHIKGPYSTHGSATIPGFRISHATSTVRLLLNNHIDESITLQKESKNEKTFLRKLSLDFASVVTVNKNVIDNDIPIHINMETDRARVTYIPNNSGMFDINLICNGELIRGSPFRVSVTNNISGLKDSFEKHSTVNKEFVKSNTTIHRKVLSSNIDFIHDKELVSNHRIRINQTPRPDLDHHITSVPTVNTSLGNATLRDDIDGNLPDTTSPYAVNSLPVLITAYGVQTEQLEAIAEKTICNRKCKKILSEKLDDIEERDNFNSSNDELELPGEIDDNISSEMSEIDLGLNFTPQNNEHDIAGPRLQEVDITLQNKESIKSSPATVCTPRLNCALLEINQLNNNLDSEIIEEDMLEEGDVILFQDSTSNLSTNNARNIGCSNDNDEEPMIEEKIIEEIHESINVGQNTIIETEQRKFQDIIEVKCADELRPLSTNGENSKGNRNLPEWTSNKISSNYFLESSVPVDPQTYTNSVVNSHDKSKKLLLNNIQMKSAKSSSPELNEIKNFETKRKSNLINVYTENFNIIENSLPNENEKSLLIVKEKAPKLFHDGNNNLNNTSTIVHNVSELEKHTYNSYSALYSNRSFQMTSPICSRHIFPEATPNGSTTEEKRTRFRKQKCICANESFSEEENFDARDSTEILRDKNLKMSHIIDSLTKNCSYYVDSNLTFLNTSSLPNISNNRASEFINEKCTKTDFEEENEFRKSYLAKREFWNNLSTSTLSINSAIDKPKPSRNIRSSSQTTLEIKFKDTYHDSYIEISQSVDDISSTATYTQLEISAEKQDQDNPIFFVPIEERKKMLLKDRYNMEKMGNKTPYSKRESEINPRNILIKKSNLTQDAENKKVLKDCNRNPADASNVTQTLHTTTHRFGSRKNIYSNIEYVNEERINRCLFSQAMGFFINLEMEQQLKSNSTCPNNRRLSLGSEIKMDESLKKSKSLPSTMERFSLSDLYSDVVSNTSGSFKGTPNREAITVTLASFSKYLEKNNTFNSNSYIKYNLFLNKFKNKKSISVRSSLDVYF